MAKLGNYLYGTAAQTGGTELAGGRMVQKSIPGTKGLLTKHPAITAGVGTALTAGAVAPELEEEINIDVDDPTAHKKYLTNRGMFEDEWAEWLVSKGDADTKEEALELVRENPMFSGGGRVKAQGGLFAGQMPGRHPGMNPMNQMNQGLGAPNLGSRSMGMTPGMGAGQDPRMAQLMQGQGRLRTGTVPGESPDTELIQLIKMLTSLGIPMEQLRGRTKEELVEMLVSVKGKPESGPDVKETAGVIEEEDIRETQEVAGGGRIGYQTGDAILPMPRPTEENMLIKIAKALFRLTPMGAGALAAEQAIKMYQNLDPDTQAKVQTIGKQLSQGATMMTLPGMAIGLGKKTYDMYQDRAGDEEVEDIDEEVIGANIGGLMRTGYAMGTEHPVIPSKDGKTN